VLTYPRVSLRLARARLTQLEKLGVKRIILGGRVKLGGLSLLGIGTVSLVVRAETEDGDYALKVRRTDANRKSMKAEFDFTRLANRIGSGPAVKKCTRDFITMQYLNGVELGDWLKALSGRGRRATAKDIVHKLLNQCRKLDVIGLDHGQLSNLRKHVLVLDDFPYILDFESASTVRKPKNVTSAAQYLFVGGKISSLVRRITGINDERRVIQSLKAYKHEMGDMNYANLLNTIGIAS
jgi:putative serine/threonine protein kinase